MHFCPVIRKNGHSALTSVTRSRWSLFALLMIVGAILSEGASKQRAARAMMTIARAATMRTEARALQRAIAERYLVSCGQWNAIGLGLAAIAFMSWITSVLSHDSGNNGKLLILFAMYALIFLIIV
jgi:hypothetical protein